jgi:hypothetical protein
MDVAFQQETHNPLGQTFRTLHQEHFFLFTAKPRNILVRRTPNTPQIIIIDIPYALRIAKQPFVRWAQAFDLAVFLGNFARLTSQEQEASFYNAYLPDPLGSSREDLERRVRGAIRWHRNQTPVSWLVHVIRGAVKKSQRQQRKRTGSFRRSAKSLLLMFELAHIAVSSDIKTATSLLRIMF